MAYHFYLGETLLPIPPSKLTLKVKNKNSVLTMSNERELNVLKSPGLTEISFEATLPQTQYPFAVYSGGYKDARYFLNVLEQYKVSKKPFQFIVSRTSPAGKLLFDTNMRVSLEDYEIKEDAKEGPDLVVKINLKQYIEFKAKYFQIVPKISPQTQQPAATATQQPNRASTKTPSKTYTVVRGDCLWNIAKKHLGNGAKYTEIYARNKDLIESTARKHGKKSSENGRWIYPGMVLQMP